MDFVVLDFETAAQGKIEACEIGLAFVRNGKAVNYQSWFIKPPCYPNFNSYFINRVHGITPMDVANSPTFPGIWNIIHPLIEGKLLFVHNASFDMDVLYQTLAFYKLPSGGW